MKYRSMFLAILSGILLVLVFPRANLEFLAWIALVPLFLAIRGKSPKNTFGLGLLTGLVSFLGILYWIQILSPLIGLLALAFYLALYIAFFCFLLTFINRKLKSDIWYLISAPILWVSLEYIRSVFLSGFPWALLGYSQYLNTPLIQISEFTGVYGVSFLIVLVNVTIAHLITDHRSLITVHRKILPAIIVAIIVGACFTYGKLILRTSHLRSRNSELKVGIVQGNVDLEEKWSGILHQKVMDTHIRLTEEVAKEEPKLIVWSETATASCLKHEKGDLARLSDLARKAKSHLLIGSLDLAPEGSYYNKEASPINRGEPYYSGASLVEGASEARLYNSAFLISPEGNITRQYNKVHLVPFGEVIPLRRQIPLLARFVERMGGGGFKPGEELTIFNINGKRFGVLICYEGIFDNLVRKFVKTDADFIINITNDAWYEKTSAPYQHFSFSIFRAVENRVPIVRAANTGVSGFIDSQGQIRKDLDIFIEGTLVDKINLKRQETFYTRFGNLFAYLCSGLSILLLTGAWIKRVL